MKRGRPAALAVALWVLASGLAGCERRPVAPPPPDRHCAVDADCMAWPSGCCSWTGLNVKDTRPPGPGAECELACPTAVGAVRCVAGQCEVETLRAPR